MFLHVQHHIKDRVNRTHSNIVDMMRFIATIVALAVASGATTVPGLAKYLTACDSEVQARPAAFFEAADDMVCSDSRKAFRVFSLRWHPDRKPEGLTDPVANRLFKCANSAYQRMMRPCEKTMKHRDDDTPQHHHDDDTPGHYQQYIHDAMLFVFKLVSLWAVLSILYGLTQPPWDIDYAAQHEVSQEPLLNIDVAARNRAMQERAHAHGSHSEMGIYRYDGRMVIQRRV